MTSEQPHDAAAATADPGVDPPADPAIEGPIDAPIDKHPLQRLMDNPWVLLALGLLIPLISYTAWGWIELLLIETAQLP